MEKTGAIKRQFSNVARIAGYMFRFKWRIVIAIAILLVSKGLSVAGPYILKLIIDELNAGVALASAGFLMMLAAIYFVSTSGTSILDAIKDYVFSRAESMIKKIIALDLFKHLLALSVDFHTNRATGGVSRKITRGISALEMAMFFVTSNIIPTLVQILLIIGIFLFLFPLSFSLVLVGFIIVYVAFTIYVAERRQKILLELNLKDDAANASAIDALLNYEAVKYFNNENYEYRKYDERLTDWVEFDIRGTRSGANLNMGQGIIITIGITALLLLALQRFLSGEGTVGDFILVTTYIGQISIPLTFLGFIYGRVKEGLAATDEMFRLLEVKNNVQDKTDAETLQNVKGEIEFRNVNFSYTDEREVLKGISFNVPAKTSVALVGYSGSGKSTISKLLLRFYDVTSGKICVDGKDIRDVTQDSLRQNIGVVAQDSILFNDTIFNNILYGKPEASREEVERAAQIAHIHDFIVSELPQKYETVVGERGVKLSGGEKQRVAIARMLLKNPSILVFDEATASLDSKAEKIIQDAIKELSGTGRTTLVIAHRLSTIADFDHIIVMDKGQIVESGTHDELLSKQGVYFRLWTIQNKKHHTEEDLESEN